MALAALTVRQIQVSKATDTKAKQHSGNLITVPTPQLAAGQLCRRRYLAANDGRGT